MFLEEKIREINQRLEKAGNGKIAVWCLGVHTEKLAEYTTLLKYNIQFFIDKNAEMYGGGGILNYMVSRSAVPGKSSVLI